MEPSLAPRPRVPEWARWAGLPCPLQGEGFEEYVLRLGLDPVMLLDGLTENTAYIANRRLATELMRRMPKSYEAYVQARRRGFYPNDLGS